MKQIIGLSIARAIPSITTRPHVVVSFLQEFVSRHPRSASTAPSSLIWSSVRVLKGDVSPWMEVTTGALSKDWYLILTPYNTAPYGVRTEVTITASTQGYDTSKGGWATLSETVSVVSEVLCYEVRICQFFFSFVFN